MRGNVNARSTVTVGGDGSRASLDAVEWASAYARLWEASLRIVTVGASGPARRGPVSDSRRQISREEFQTNQRLRRRAEAAFSRAVGAVPEDRIEMRVVAGDPVDALLAAADGGPLVVGTRRLGFLSGTIAGSVSRRLIGRSPGPVAVVSGAASQGRGRVVAGVDGGPSTGAVVSYALEEARIRGAELLLFRAIGDSSPNERSGTAAVEEAKGSGRDVRVREEERRGDPVDLLVERSAEADLIVVGTRSLGLTAGLLRGSVGQRLTVRARCPVVVIPG